MESLTIFQAGQPRKKALQLFRESVNQADTIFSTDHWLSPKLKQLQALLSEPITADQAKVLNLVLHGHTTMSTLLEWLQLPPISWDGYTHNLAEQAQEDLRTKEKWHSRKRAWAEAQRNAWSSTPLSELVAQNVKVKVRGRKICRIPESAKEHPSFLSWWFAVGRVNPDNAAGWSEYETNSRYEVRVELISEEAWIALDPNERESIERWINRLPLGAGVHFNYG